MIHYCDYRYKTISRPSVCYEEEKYCCDGYTLENNMCVCKFTISFHTYCQSHVILVVIVYAFDILYTYMHIYLETILYFGDSLT